MWDEINDMEGEIFDFDDVSDDIPSILSLTDEDINQLIDEHEANTDDNDWSCKSTNSPFNLTVENFFNNTSFLDKLHKLSAISSNTMDTKTTQMLNSSSQSAAIDEPDAFAMALESRAAHYEVTVDYYIEEFLL